ncbi:MAG: helix-turn-helix transcriptional regulator [Caulobacteraceae bacterium]|nr:helix-turn-helix transcriptional regulator [Caulobacteraceae bacterium]
MARDGEPNPIDVHVGRRVRVRRHAVGLSQQALATQLGLTFQQVQKYERGANRISASKLFEISQILTIPVAYFFDGLDAEANVDDGRNDLAERLLVEPGGRALAQSFLAIRSRSMKRRFLELAESVAAHDQIGAEDALPDAQEVP